MDKTGKRINELRSKAPGHEDFQVVEKKKRKKKNTAPLWVSLILCIAALIGVVGYGYTLIKGRIREGTMVAGVNLSGMEPEAAAVMLRGLTEAQTLSVSDEEGKCLFTLPLTAVVGKQDYAANLDSAMKGGALFRISEETAAAAVEAALYPESYVEDAPLDAVLAAGEDALYFTEPTHGNLYDAQACTAAVCAFLSGEPAFGNIWQITVDNAYERCGSGPSEAMVAQKEAVEAFTNAQISISFLSGIEYTLSFSDILSMLNEDCLVPGTEVRVEPERLSARMDVVCEELGVDGTMAKYGRCADTREYLYLTPNDTGFKLDRATLDQRLCEAVTNHSGYIETSYDYTWWLKQTYGWRGNVSDCLEISLDNQYIWFYKNGQLLTESPIVSGDVLTNNITRLGVFQMYGMVTDTVLTGPTWNDHVDYWIPFDGGIGIHDSDWRDEYGGDIYKETGSHGCVNTPLEPMRIIYENSYLGLMVIVRN